MFKLLYLVVNVICLVFYPTLGFIMFFIGYAGIVLEDHMQHKKKPKNKYKERFEKLTKKKTSYIVDDYETDKTTTKICQ